MRPSFETIYMNLAIKLSERSTCARLQVGTVITTTDFRKVLAIGYNGNASGLHNGCDSTEVGACGCLHSEENAIINCDVSRNIDNALKDLLILEMLKKFIIKMIIETQIV